MDLPSEMPTGIPIGRSRAGSRAKAAAPALLNPIRLMIASLERSRNSRGWSLPGWAWAVTVPSSTKPKPSAGQAFAATPSLSIPAASPTADGKSTPNTVAGALVSGQQQGQGRSAGPDSADRTQRRKGGVVGVFGVAVPEPEQHRLRQPAVRPVQRTHRFPTSPAPR